MLYCTVLFFTQVKSLTFDQSGTYLAVAGSDVRVYLCKQWQDLCVFSGKSFLILVNGLLDFDGEEKIMLPFNLQIRSLGKPYQQKTTTACPSRQNLSLFPFVVMQAYALL